MEGLDAAAMGLEAAEQEEQEEASGEVGRYRVSSSSAVRRAVLYRSLCRLGILVAWLLVIAAVLYQVQAAVGMPLDPVAAIRSFLTTADPPAPPAPPAPQPLPPPAPPPPPLSTPPPAQVEPPVPPNTPACSLMNRLTQLGVTASGDVVWCNSDALRRANKDECERYWH